MSEVEQRLCKYVILGTEKTDEGIEKPYNRESDFLTLKNIDEKFTAYDGIQDFKEEYEKQHGIKLENFNIQLLYYTNKSLGKVEMLPILFSEDVSVLDVAKTDHEFEANMYNPAFALHFINSIDSERAIGLKQDIHKVVLAVNTNGNYIIPLKELMEKVKGSYGIERLKYLTLSGYKKNKFSDLDLADTADYRLYDGPTKS